MTPRSKNEILESLKVDGWNLSNEREFMENLYVGRFNYFLVVFSLVTTAGFANNFKDLKSMVFYVGAFLLFLVWLVLYRGYKKHDRIMKIIFKDKAEHPAALVQELMHLEGFKPKYRVSRLMGVYIPWVCILFLALTGLLINCEKLN